MSSTADQASPYAAGEGDGPAPGHPQPPGAELVCSQCSPPRVLKNRAALTIHTRFKHPGTAVPSAGEEGHPKERKPKPKSRTGPRKKTSDLLGALYGLAGKGFARSGDWPVYRMMELNTPVAGEAVDQALADTFIDRKLLQPLMNVHAKGQLAEVVVGGPFIVALMERRPALQPMLMPALEEIVELNLDAMADILKRRQAKARQRTKVLADTGLLEQLREMGMPEGGDAVQFIIASIFAPPPDDEAPPAPAHEEA